MLSIKLYPSRHYFLKQQNKFTIIFVRSDLVCLQKEIIKNGLKLKIIANILIIAIEGRFSTTKFIIWSGLLSVDALKTDLFACVIACLSSWLPFQPWLTPLNGFFLKSGSFEWIFFAFSNTWNAFVSCFQNCEWISFHFGLLWMVLAGHSIPVTCVTEARISTKDEQTNIVHMCSLLNLFLIQHSTNLQIVWWDINSRMTKRSKVSIVSCPCL